jgi:hypothetical protein
MKLTGPSLSEIPRHELIAAALELGVDRPELLSPEQLREKIRAASAGATKEPPGLGRVSLFSVARNLIASVVERGLNLPDAARVIRDTVRPSPRHRPPLPTVTLAQIYLAQGYADRAIQTLLQVIEREPNNYTAVELYQRLTRSRDDQAGAHEVDGAPSNAAENVSIAPGVAARSALWYAPDESVTRGVRDALVLLEREPKQITVYWELSERRSADLLRIPSEIRVLCYGGTAGEPREINVPLHAAFGWAVVELIDDEVPCACLTVSGRVVATALRARLIEAPAASRAEVVFSARTRAFWNDVVERAAQ